MHISTRVACAENTAKLTPPARGVAPSGYGRPGASAVAVVMPAPRSNRLEHDGCERRQRHAHGMAAPMCTDGFRLDRVGAAAHAAAAVAACIGVQHLAPG